MSHFNNVNVGVTGFVFDSRYTFTGLGYLAVCWQKQWGNLWAGYTEVLNWYFPLTTSQVYAVCLTKHTKNISSGHNWEPARIEEWNNSYARIHPDGDLGYSVIAICKAQQQWGMNIHGWVIFPIPFTKFRRLVTNHQGNVFMDSKARESNTLSGFTLDVADNSDQNKDAQWIAIGA